MILFEKNVTFVIILNSVEQNFIDLNKLQSQMCDNCELIIIISKRWKSQNPNFHDDKNI